MATSSAGVQLRVLPGTARDEAGARWRALEERLGPQGIACSWAWTSAYLEHYGRDLDHVFVVGERDGDSIGAALLTSSVRRLRGIVPVRTIRVGTAGEPRSEIYVEYNRLLVAEGDRQAFAEALVTHARKQRRWDEFRLDGFVTDQAQPLVTQGRWQVRHEVCPVMDLAPARAHGDVMQLLSKNSRYRVRRSLRALGSVTSEWAETEEHALDILKELTALHEARWLAEGRQGVLGGPQASSFHRALVRALLPVAQVALFRVRSEGRTIGCIYGHIENGRLLQYQSGFAPSTESKVKHGLVTHTLCMQSALDRRLDAYDLLAGDHRYKRELSNTESQLVWASRWAPTPRGQALALAHRLAQRQRRATEGSTADLPAAAEAVGEQ